MIYDFRCQGKCKRLTTVSVQLHQYEELKRSIKCCGIPMEREFSPPTVVFAREGFPKGYEITEHCMDEPVYCKDKAQLKDICAETNTVSRFIEDDV